MATAADQAVKYPDYEGDPVALSDEHRFLFDLNGWVCIPNVLTPDETVTIREHVQRLHDDKESVDPLERYPFAGPGQILLDHPVLVGALEAFIDRSRPNAYGFRCEGAFSVVRPFGKEDHQFAHRGPRNGPFLYRYENDRIYSGLTRVVWELNDVGPDDHATGFISGSHKMNFPMPEKFRHKDSGLLSTYSCPAGSLVIFSENTIHAGMPWQNREHPRIAILMAYNSWLAQWHKLSVPTGVINTMPPKRRTLFRGVWGHDFKEGRSNDFFDETNVEL